MRIGFAFTVSVVALSVCLAACVTPGAEDGWESDVREKRSAGAAVCNALPAAVGALPCDADGDGTLDVLVLFDTAGGGEAHAQWLVNLLGHFAEVKVEAWAIEDYPQGELAGNDVAFYFGTDWEARPGPSFRRDFFENDRPFIAMGANARSLFAMNSELFEEVFGVSFLFTAENTGTGAGTHYFRDVRYQHRVLPRPGAWDPVRGVFANDPFVQVFRILDGSRVDVIADVVHTGHGAAVPYIFRSENLTVVADNPFAYADVRGHYLVFADVLHDLIGVQHVSTRRSILRIDDVHPMTSAAPVLSIAEVMKKGEATRPYALSVIPRFENPLGIFADGRRQRLEIDDGRAGGLRKALVAAVDSGAEIVQNGFTHQLDDRPNPVNGLTSVDYEFWDARRRTPVPGDSAQWARTRVDRGQRALANAGLMTRVFEVPNHRASVVDYLEFAERFDAAWSRVWYQPYRIEMSGSDVEVGFARVFNRQTAASDGRVAVTAPPLGPQVFPYTIFNDVYGQAVLPDNLGSVTPGPGDSDGRRVLRVKDLLIGARTLQVGRCAVAGFSHHPFLVQQEDLPDGGAEGLRSLVEGMEALGYEFVRPSSLLNPLSRTPRVAAPATEPIEAKGASGAVEPAATAEPSGATPTEDPTEAAGSTEPTDALEATPSSEAAAAWGPIQAAAATQEAQELPPSADPALLAFADAYFRAGTGEEGERSADFAFWGWSKDGKRYAFEEHVQGPSGRSATLRVVDAASDSYVEGGTVRLEDGPEGDPFERMTAARQAHLDRFGIQVGLGTTASALTRDATRGPGSVVVPTGGATGLAFDLSVTGRPGAAEGRGYLLEVKEVGRAGVPILVEDGERLRAGVTSYRVAAVFVGPDRQNVAIITGTSGRAGESRRVHWITNGVRLPAELAIQGKGR